MEEMDVEAVGALAAEDQALAEARNAARALGRFWENLPETMDADLRGLLILKWQDSLSRWQSFEYDEEND